MIVPTIKAIGTAVPPHDVHAGFLKYGRTLLADERTRLVFDRMAERSGISHRFSFLKVGRLDAGEVDAEGFYRPGDFPGTAARMARYERHAIDLALRAIATIDIGPPDRITHLFVASCTGFVAPGLDLQLAARLGLRPSVERAIIGFMGCSAAVPALRAAYHAIRSDASARVLVVNLELCTLHLQESADLETVLSFLLFGDGCAAALVSAAPGGIGLDDFRSAIIPDSQEMITWRIGEQGFDMHLSGQVPTRIAQALRADLAAAEPGGIFRSAGIAPIDLWAVHAGGRTVLDAVEIALSLPPAALADSRRVLESFGNMSSATIMFVLAGMMARGAQGRGMAMAFGPGMVAETFRFTL